MLNTIHDIFGILIAIPILIVTVWVGFEFIKILPSLWREERQTVIILASLVLWALAIIGYLITFPNK